MPSPPPKKLNRKLGRKQYIPEDAVLREDMRSGSSMGALTSGASDNNHSLNKPSTRKPESPNAPTDPEPKQGSGFRVQGSGFRVQGSGFRVQGLGFRV